MKDRIWKFILQEEGGYVNHPNDPGGETKYGITKARYPHLDIKNLTEEQAQEIYFKDYFPQINGEDILPINPGLALVLGDFAFNAGPMRAVITLQEAVNRVMQNKVLEEDGIVGPLTLQAVVNISNDDRTAIYLIDVYRQVRQEFYERLSSLFAVFGKGWTARNKRASEEAIKLLQEKK